MNDPSYTDEIDEDLMEELKSEYMALAEKGDRATWDFALEFSDKVNVSLQEIGMGLMVSAPWVPSETYSESGETVLVRATRSIKQDSPVALWARCARRALLDVLEKEAAPEWARTEYERRHQENL